MPREAEARSPERAEHRRACALPIVCLPGSSGRRARQFSALSLSVAKVGDGKEAATSGCINPTNPTPAAACLLLPRRSAEEGRGQPHPGQGEASERASERRDARVQTRQPGLHCATLVKLTEPSGREERETEPTAHFHHLSILFYYLRIYKSELEYSNPRRKWAPALVKTRANLKSPSDVFSGKLEGSPRDDDLLVACSHRRRTPSSSSAPVA